METSGGFRDYSHARSRVEEFYALNHARRRSRSCSRRNRNIFL